MYIPALDVARGLPEIDIEEEMEGVAQMSYSVSRAKNAHLRATVNQFRLSEVELVLILSSKSREQEGYGEYKEGQMFIRYGDAFEYPLSITPSETGCIISSFTDYTGDDVEDADRLSEESWTAIHEAVEWGNAGDDSVEFPVALEDFPQDERWHVWNGILYPAYGQDEQMCAPEVRVALELAQYKAGVREDAQLREL